MRSWMEQVTAVRLYRGLVVRSVSEPASAVLRSLGDAREIAPGVFVVGEHRDAEVRETLRRAGYRVSLPTHRVWDSFVEVKQRRTPPDEALAKLVEQMNLREVIHVEPPKAEPRPARPHPAPQGALIDPRTIRECLARFAEIDEPSFLRISYAGHQGNSLGIHTIEPMEIVRRGGVEFIEAYDFETDEIRLFEIGRIRSVMLVSEDDE